MVAPEIGGIVMGRDIKKSDVKKLYGQLGISQEFWDLNEESFFDYNKNDRHLAWKPLTV